MIEPGMRMPPADRELPVNDKYIEAVNLNAQICISAQAAQQNLYDMCMGFKKMRDSKLYKELGYTDFGEYCENETGIKRRQAYRMIDIAEKLPENFVPSMAQIGTTKLYLLTKLSEEQRTEITENTDLENTSVRKLEEKIRQLKDENEQAVRRSECDKAEIRSLQARLDNTGDAMRSAAQEAKQYKDRIARLEAEIKELENRPIDVAVQDNSAEENRLRETIKSLERENIRRNEELEEQYRKDEQAVRRMLEKEKQEALDELRAELERTKAEYERQLAQKPKESPVTDDKEIFRAYISSAVDSVTKLMDFISQHKDSANLKLFRERSARLSEVINRRLEELK